MSSEVCGPGCPAYMSDGCDLNSDAMVECRRPARERYPSKRQEAPTPQEIRETRGEATMIHDWDSATLSGRKVLRRGISLIVYALSRWFPWLNWWGRVLRNNEALEGERLAHLETLIKLDELLGEVPIFGIRDEVMEVHSEEILRLVKGYDVELRRHIHVGSPPDPNRLRLWVPPLIQSMSSWTFEKEFIEGRGELAPGDLPIFHVDNPENLGHYIAYIYETRARRDK